MDVGLTAFNLLTLALSAGGATEPTTIPVLPPARDRAGGRTVGQAAAVIENALPLHLEHQRRVKTLEVTVNSSFTKELTKQWLDQVLQMELEDLQFAFTTRGSNYAVAQRTTLSRVKELNRRFAELDIINPGFRERHPELYLQYTLKLRQAWTRLILFLLHKIKKREGPEDPEIINIISDQMSDNNQEQVLAVLRLMQARNDIREIIDLGANQSITGNTGITIIVVPQQASSCFIPIKLPRASIADGFTPDISVNDLYQKDLDKTVSKFVLDRSITEPGSNGLPAIRAEIITIKNEVRELATLYERIFQSGSSITDQLEQDHNLQQPREPLKASLEEYFSDKRAARAKEQNLYSRAFEYCSQLPAYEGLLHLNDIHKRILEEKIKSLAYTISSPASSKAATLVPLLKDDCARTKVDQLQYDVWGIVNNFFDRKKLVDWLSTAQGVLATTIGNITKYRHLDIMQQ
jgi:hypothetical protein